MFGFPLARLSDPAAGQGEVDAVEGEGSAGIREEDIGRVLVVELATEGDLVGRRGRG